LLPAGHPAAAGRQHHRPMSEPYDSRYQPIASRNHAIGMLAIIAVLTWLGALSVARHTAKPWPHRTWLYLEMMIEEGLILAYVAWGVRREGGSLRQLIGGRWARLWDVGRDVLVALGFWIAALIGMGILGLALRLNRGANPALFLAPRSRTEIVLWVLTSMAAGFSEEIVFRGYLQRQFLAWSGQPVAGILLSAVIFGGSHAYQGAPRAAILAAYGAMLGLLAHRRQSLRPGMIAHAWQDTVFGLTSRFLVRQ
jgi:uncharacterized protein